MHLKRFFGRVFAFLTKSACYALGVVAVLGLTLGTFALMQWIGEEDARDDRDIGSVVMAIPVFVGSVVAYVYWFVPKMRRESFFVSWINSRPRQKAPKQPTTKEGRHRSILRVLGGIAVPVIALITGFLWEIGTRDTQWSGLGMYAAIAVSCILCGLYFGVYLRAVNKGRVTIGQLQSASDDSLEVAAAPLYEHPQKEVFIVDPRRGHNCIPKQPRGEPSRANQRQPDGSIEYAFESKDYNEWFL